MRGLYCDFRYYFRVRETCISFSTSSQRPSVKGGSFSESINATTVIKFAGRGNLCGRNVTRILNNIFRVTIT